MPATLTDRPAKDVRHIAHQAVYDLLHRRSRPDVRRIYERAADRLLDRIRTDYLIKANGGRDAAGIRWEDTRARQLTGEMMMFRTGTLFASLRVEPTARGLLIHVNEDQCPYARFALSSRPAWPPDGRIPDEWWRIVTDEILKGLKRLIRARL